VKKKPKRQIVIATVILLVIIALATIYAELAGFIIIRKTEDMSGSEDAISILFVGNSHVFVGNLPQQLKTIARMHNVEIDYKDLSRHANRGGTLSELRESAISEMRSKQYDYIVLTCNGRQISNDYESFLGNVQILSDIARENEVIPVLYNAAWTADKENLDIAAAAYKRAADELDIVLVNAADAWIYAYQEMPDVSLITRFDPRGPHANKAGGFLTACVFAATLFDLHIEEIPGDSQYKGNDAIELAQVAWYFTLK